MEALTINNLCGYLPYGLKCQPKEQSYLLNYPLEIKGVGGETVITSKKSFPFTQDFHISKIKPICFPLSDLTKPITINGETFVPMVELFKYANGNFQQEIRYWSVMATNEIQIEMLGLKNYFFRLIKDECDVRIANPLRFDMYSTNLINEEPKPEIVQCPLFMMEKLFEWKFAINLPEGSWIDVNSLKENPYK